MLNVAAVMLANTVQSFMLVKNNARRLYLIWQFQANICIFLVYVIEKTFMQLPLLTTTDPTFGLR